MAVAVAVAVAVSGGGAVAVAGLTKRFFNHIQKDFLINVWGYMLLHGNVSPMNLHLEHEEEMDHEVMRVSKKRQVNKHTNQKHNQPFMI